MSKSEIWKLILIFLVGLNNEYHTDNDASNKVWFHLVVSKITKQIQSCNLREDGRFFQLWTCFVYKRLSEITIYVKGLYQCSLFKPTLSVRSVKSIFKFQTWMPNVHFIQGKISKIILKRNVQNPKIQNQYQVILQNKNHDLPNGC